MDHGTTTVADLEVGLQNALEALRELERSGRMPEELRPLLLLCPMDGASVHVSLRHRDMARQIRRNYGAQAFSQRSCGAWIVFEAPHNDWHEERRALPAGDPFADFVRAMHQAESEPQLSFVSLKWFRDTYLIKCGFEWAQDPDVARRLIHEAMERDVVRTRKVPNPRSPEHPVTALVLNREHADVGRILAGAAAPAQADPAAESHSALT
jgi:hypothetical protein